jgi:GNAT superfamily N-acetyltransferase
VNDNIKLTIRKVQTMDIGALREMSVAFVKEEFGIGLMDYPHMDEAEVDKHMLNVLMNKDKPDMIYLIAYAGKKPVGFCLGYIGWHEWGSPTRVGVGQELYVVPEKRGGKVALKLMEKAFEIAIKQGVESLECIGSYNGTDKKWAKFGFKPHLTYGHMPKDKFISLVKRFTKEGSENV